MNNTKQEILDTALDLFSKKGFSAVSIRDICAVVKIKESTIYYHVKNKEAILDELLTEFETRSEALIAKMYSGLSNLSSAENAGEDLFSKIIDNYVDNYLADSFCNKVIRILFIDQLNNPKVEKLYSYWLFEKPLEIQTFAVTMFKDKGLIPCEDPSFIAEKFYAPIFFLMTRWLLSGELTEEKIENFKKSVYRHCGEFIK